MYHWTAEARDAAWKALGLKSQKGLNAKFSERCLMYVHLIASYSDDELSGLKTPYGTLRKEMGSSGDGAAVSPSEAAAGAVVRKKPVAWVQAFALAKGRVSSRRPDSAPQVESEGDE
jgi:hypothetical protein